MKRFLFFVTLGLISSLDAMNSYNELCNAIDECYVQISDEPLSSLCSSGKNISLNKQDFENLSEFNNARVETARDSLSKVKVKPEDHEDLHIAVSLTNVKECIDKHLKKCQGKQ